MKKYLAITLLAACCTSQAEPWKYTEDVDKMTGKVTKFATLRSTNSLDLSFPYKGLNPGMLTVRHHPRAGVDVTVDILKGQILCPNPGGCRVLVRFGEGKPEVFPASPPDDHSSTTVFLNNAKGFIEQLKKAKSIKVQMTIYQAGNQILEFDTPEPLVWGAPTKTKAK